MSVVAPFVPDRFASTIPFYVAHRLRYPPALVREVAARVGLARGDRVFDLGCGPGFLAVAFACHCGCEVIGMDPDASMIAAAREEAKVAGVEIGLVQGSSYDLRPGLGPFKLVTMGRSFHWMDRAATLQMLDAMIAPEGGVALFNDGHEKSRSNRWRDILKEVQNRFVGRSASERMRLDPEWDSHATILLDSAFSLVERYGIVERRPLTVEAIVGRALSMSASSPQALGDRREAFEAELEARLRAFSPSGVCEEIVEFSALIGRRPDKGLADLNTSGP